MFNCELCGSSDSIYELILDKYPLTNIYKDIEGSNHNYLRDARLCQCKCGHVQLSSRHEPTSIYVNDYPYNGEALTVQSRRKTGIFLIQKYLTANEPG